METFSWKDIILGCGMALAGGLVRVFSLKKQQALKSAQVLSELFISGFSGMIALLLCDYMQAPMALAGILCGVFGLLGSKSLDWAGPILLNVFVASFAKVLGIDVKDIETLERLKKESELNVSESD